MNYDKYECTPRFSYDQTRTAIRDQKADEQRQIRAIVPFMQSMTTQNREMWFNVLTHLAIPVTLLLFLSFLSLIK